MGDEWPGGSGVFQITFLPGPTSNGSPVSDEVPSPEGPRNCGQSAAGATADRINRERMRPKTCAMDSTLPHMRPFNQTRYPTAHKAAHDAPRPQDRTAT